MKRPEIAHVPGAVLERYAGGTADTGWAVEAHLESCDRCRDRLGEAVRRSSPATALLVERVRGELAERYLVRSTRARGRVARGLRRWAAPVLLPRLAMTVLVVLAAVGLDLIDQAGDGRVPSLVLLLAPVAPLLAVAASWSRGLDPAYELVVATPRAGLEMVLRRSVMVLAVVIPLLAAAGWLVGASPARWLLPCLALTSGALALGELIGLHRAATGLGVLWIAAVAGPSLASGHAPVLLARTAVGGWAAVTVVIVAVLVLRRRAYLSLPSGR